MRTLLLLLSTFSLLVASYSLRSHRLTMSAPLSSGRKCVAQSWTVPVALQSQRIHCALQALSPQTFATATAAKKAVRKGLVLLNGETAAITDAVRAADELQFLQNFGGLDRVLPPLPEDRCEHVCVCWEDEHLAVCVKPQGMPVFTEKESSRTALATVVCHQLTMHTQSQSTISTSPSPSPSPSLSTEIDEEREENEVKEREEEEDTETDTHTATEALLNYRRRPQPVHRLDRETGGLVVVAKTFEALRGLTQAFARRAVHKTYWALVEGVLSPAEDSISFSIDGKDALTHYKQRWTRRWRGREVSCLEVHPVTGRKNQIRRHLKMVGHAIVNDDRFNTMHDRSDEDDKMFLWAVEITFPHPASNEEVTVKLPAEFTQAFRDVQESSSEITLPHTVLSS